MAEDRPYRVVAMADSLALPRDERGEGLLWEETWHYRLERHLESAGHLLEVVNCGIRARTACSLNGPDSREHVLHRRPAAVVLQVGGGTVR